MLKSLLKGAAVAALLMGASSTYAQEPIYLCDVATEAELTEDIFGVPMRIDYLGDGKYEARYYNQKANNEIYFLSSKTSMEHVIGLMFDEVMEGPADALDPFVLPEAGKYYSIKLDLTENTYSIDTYEVADYMDPVFWEFGSDNLNVWFNFVEGTRGEENDNFEHHEEAWLRTFYFGYTCTEYLINDDNEYVDENGNVLGEDEDGNPIRVMAKALNPLGEEVNAEQLRWCQPWTQDPNNPHLYTWTEPKHFVAGQKLNFIVHNWHEAGWWNYVTWRVDDEQECDIFYYYGEVVKQAYLDWAWGKDETSVLAWRDDSERKRLMYDGGGDCWCKPTVQTTGDYVFQFDTHLGRGKMVPAGSIPDGINNAVADENVNAPVEYYNLQGMRLVTPKAGQVVIVKQGSKVTKRVF